MNSHVLLTGLLRSGANLLALLDRWTLIGGPERGRFIVSTWQEECDRQPWLVDALQNGGATVLSSSGLADDTYRNYYRQQLLLEVGLLECAPSDYVLKIRSDWVLSCKHLEHLLGGQESSAVEPRFGEVLASKVVVPWWSTRVPFHIADESVAGVASDLISFNPRDTALPLADPHAGKYLPHLVKHFPKLKFVTEQFLPYITESQPDDDQTVLKFGGNVSNNRHVLQQVGPYRFDATSMALDIPSYQRCLALYFWAIDKLFTVYNPTPKLDQFIERHGPWAVATPDVFVTNSPFMSPDPICYFSAGFANVVKMVGTDMSALLDELHQLESSPELAFEEPNAAEYARDAAVLQERVFAFREERSLQLNSQNHIPKDLLRASIERSPRRRFSTLDEMDSVARQRLSSEAYAYLIDGAGQNETRDRNRAAFAKVTLRPTYLSGLKEVDTSAMFLNKNYGSSVGAAPIGSDLLFHPDGARAIATAAENAGALAIVSEAAGWSLEAVAAHSGGDKLMQFHPLGSASDAIEFAHRAAAAGYLGLCITVDCPTLGWREANRRNRFSPPSRVFSANHADSNFVATLTTGLGSGWTWSTFSQIAQGSPLPVLAKGILTEVDAIRAMDSGASALIVSNHGGRQIDGVSSTLEALPMIRAAVGEDYDIGFDGGIRSGSDALKAFALGASYVFVGRPMALGLGANGAEGATEVLRLLNAELRNELTILGHESLPALRGCAVFATDGMGARSAP